MSKPHLYLHIGTPKTGTTTLQNLCAANRELLAENGLCYPTYPGRKCHFGLLMLAREGEASDALLQTMRLSRVELPDYIENFTARLGEEIAATGCQKVLLSNELLAGRLRHGFKAERMLAELGKIFDGITVIVYLRPQRELVTSAWSTHIKGGSARPLRIDRDESEHFYNYHRIVSLWEGVVGRDNMRVRRFVPSAFEGGSFLSDFFGLLDFPLPEGAAMPPQLNQALGAWEAELHRMINQRADTLEPRAARRIRMQLLPLLRNIRVGPKLALGAEDCARLDAEFSESNRAVAEAYFPELNGQLFEPPARTVDAPPPLGLDSTVDIFLRLWLDRAAVQDEREPPGRRRSGKGGGGAGGNKGKRRKQRIEHTASA